MTSSLGYLPPKSSCRARFLSRSFEWFIPFTIGTSVNHALYADVFVQSDTPVDVILIVDAELLA